MSFGPLSECLEQMRHVKSVARHEGVAGQPNLSKQAGLRFLPGSSSLSSLRSAI